MSEKFSGEAQDYRARWEMANQNKTAIMVVGKCICSKPLGGHGDGYQAAFDFGLKGVDYKGITR